MAVTRLLPKLVVGVAGLASLAYLAWRQTESATLTRRVTLDSLPQQVRNWLPKLPFLRFIRFHPPGEPPRAARDEWLQISAAGTGVTLSYRQTQPSAARQRTFCDVARRYGLTVREVRESDGAAWLACDLAANAELVTPVLASLLHGLFGLTAGSALTATVPADC